VTRTLAVLLVDAFTRTRLAGNRAGVVLDATGLTEADMRAIAAELGAPATAFVQPGRGAGADVGLRWLSSGGHELSFCGHGTLAAAHALQESGQLATPRVVFGTAARALPVTLARTADGVLYGLEPAVPRLERLPEPAADGPAKLRDALGLREDELGQWAPLALTPERDLLVPVTGLHVLKSLAPPLERLAALARALALRGVCLTAPEGLEPESRCHSRFFAPLYGIAEDPVTGSVHASVAVWLWGAGLLGSAGPGGTATFRAEQGDFLGRPGRLLVELSLDGARPAAVRVGGHAVTVMSGMLTLP
jgi:PhzF family phenazine biosynthesis protein